MKNIIKQLISEALVAEFYGKSVIEPITKRFNDSSDDIINKLAIAFLFKGFFSDIMQYKTKQDFEQMFNKWYETIQNYHLVDDSPSATMNDTLFIEHRHDQSIFSLLRKKYGSIILNDETNRYIWNKNEYDKFPIYRKFT